MKKFKTIDEMRADKDLQSLKYGQTERVMISGEEYIVASTNHTYDDIIEAFFYNAIDDFNNEFNINKLPAPKGYSLEDAMFEMCTELKEKFFESYAEAGINFICVHEDENEGVVYEEIE